MHFTLSSSSSPFTYSVNDQPLDCVTKHKDLGVLVCSNLSWSDHVHSICARAYRSLYLIRRTFSTSSYSLRSQLYLSLVRSQLCYCFQLWRPRLPKDITCLEQVQRRATKYIYSSDYKSRLCSLHLLPLNSNVLVRVS